MQKAMGDSREAQRRFLAQHANLPVPAYDISSSNFFFSHGLTWGLTPVMEEIVGARLLPSYAYARIYPRGARCSVHRDRASNEHSLNLTLGYSDGIAWDFEVSKRRLHASELGPQKIDEDFGEHGHITLTMQPGDAVAYQGVHYRHARLSPNPNAWSAHLFMGWVDRQGPFKEMAFDKFELPRPANFHF
jgi:hypothetical protein